RAGIEVFVARARVVQLARRAVVTAVDLSAQDDSGPEPRADREEGEIVDAAGDPLPLLADCREVDVVLERDRAQQAIGRLTTKRAPFEPRHVRSEGDPVGRRLD